LAKHYGFPHLDTGLLYRAVAKAVLDAGYKLEDRPRVIEAALAVDPSQFDEAQLKTHAVGEAASIVAAIPDVRAALFNFQQEFADTERGAVLDGRDIGTVICPHADVKIFVTASPEERARRRTLELRALGQDAREVDVLADIMRRDERDRSRAVAPLRPADDAHVLDTTTLDIEGAVAAAIAQVERARP
jgi:cytidylate kinase